jgi:hypothetical protein
VRLSGRVHAGLAKARKQGRVGGRPRVVVDHVKIMRLHEDGETLREIGEEMPARRKRVKDCERRLEPEFNRQNRADEHERREERCFKTLDDAWVYAREAARERVTGRTLRMESRNCPVARRSRVRISTPNTPPR